MATLDSYSIGAPNGLIFIPGAPGITAMVGISFTVTDAATLNQASFLLNKNDPADSIAPYGTVTAVIYNNYSGTPGTDAVPAGAPYAISDSVAVSSLPTYWEYRLFNFSASQAKVLTPGNYILVFDGRNINNGASGTGGNGVYVSATSGAPGQDGSAWDSLGGWSSSSNQPFFRVYGTPLTPVASFTATPTSGTGTLSVTFTDTSLYDPTSWSWDFGDGGTSTSQNPTHNYTTPGLYDVTLTSTNAYGSDAEIKPDYISVIRPLSVDPIDPDSAMGDTPTITLTDPPPPPPTDWSALGKEDEKVYVYKVYTADGTFVGAWSDMKDDLQFTQRVNTPGTTTTVLLARSANTTKEDRGKLLTEAGEPITTEDGSRLVSVSKTPNSVGPDTDVELNYKVDVYVHYGEFGKLLTEAGEPITTEDGDYLLVSSGAPLGVRIFSGYILDYDSVYGADSAGVTVTLASNGYELAHEVVKSGSATTVSFSSQPLETTLKAVLDANPGVMGYDTSTIDATGVSTALKFQLNNVLQAIKTIHEQTPDDWYWYGNVADNKIYLKAKSTGYDHTFVIGKHIKSLRVKRSLEGLTNDVYIVGGELTPGDPSTTLFKHYEDSASQTAWRKGLAIVTDRRFTVAANAQRRAEKEYRLAPVFNSPLVISSARYDTESIQLGQTIGFSAAGNFLDDIEPLQIVGLTRKKTEVSLELGELLDRQVDGVVDVEDNLNNEQFEKLPSTPS